MAGAATAVLGGILCVLIGAVTNTLSTAETGRPAWTLPLVLGGVLLALSGPAMSLAQSRRAELRADGFAVALLANTPWDATALLRDMHETSRRPHLTRLLDTHPSHRRRLKRMTRT